MDTVDTPRIEALRANLEAERRAWAWERQQLRGTIARLRAKVRKLEKEADDGTD